MLFSHVSLHQRTSLLSKICLKIPAICAPHSGYFMHHLRINIIFIIWLFQTFVCHWPCKPEGCGCYRMLGFNTPYVFHLLMPFFTGLLVWAWQIILPLPRLEFNWPGLLFIHACVLNLHCDRNWLCFAWTALCCSGSYPQKTFVCTAFKLLFTSDETTLHTTNKVIKATWKVAFKCVQCHFNDVNVSPLTMKKLLFCSVCSQFSWL